MMQTPTMDPFGVILGVIGLFLAAGAIWATRQFGNRKRRLILVWTSGTVVRLPSAAGHNLEVRIDGSEVEDPHFLTVTLTNPGPNDSHPSIGIMGSL